MNYSVIGEPPRIDPQPSLRNLRSLVSTITTALELLPPDADEVVSPVFAHNIDHLLMLLTKLDHSLPLIGPLYLCGYSWANGRAWSTWSGHVNRKTAERWLAAWRAAPKLHASSRAWEIREGSCPLDKYMPKGTRIATVMGKL